MSTVNNEIKEPFVFGIFSPKIYLPCNLTTDNEYYVVEHEKKASFFSSGVCTRICDSCGNVDVEILPQIVFGNWLKEKGHRRPLLVALLLGVVIVLSRLGKKK